MAKTKTYTAGNLVRLRKGEPRAKETGRMGGLKSVALKRERKSLKERLTLALDYFTEKASSEASDAWETEMIKLLGIEVFILLKILYPDKLKPGMAPEDVLDSLQTKNKDKLKALEMLFDRIEGKPNQKTEITGLENGLNPIKVVVVRGIKPSIKEEEKEEDEYSSESRGT